MQPLTAGNARVKEARKLSRRSERSERRLFLVEGWKSIQAAAAAGCVVEVFATPSAADEYAEVLQGLSTTLVDDRALESLADAVAPQGLVAVCKFIDVPLAAIRGDLVVVCADVRDPGNAGTVIRTADAAGADAVILVGDSVDLYSPKTIRASVGSAFHLPIAIERDPLAAVEHLRGRGLTVVAADMAGESLFEADLSTPTAWLFGNEAWGLPPELRAAADRVVSIPIYGRAESLNLSTAAAVCLYASARARR